VGVLLYAGRKAEEGQQHKLQRRDEAAGVLLM